MAEFTGFVGGTYQSRSLNVDAQVSINLYPEIAQPSSKSGIVLYGTPGLVEFRELGTSPVRALWAGEERLFAVAGSKFYEVFSDGSSNLRGDVGNDAEDSPALIFPSGDGNSVLIISAGKAYLDSSRPLTGLTPHFVDKMPLNFLYAGLIHLSLPNAKIIHLTRHPMDTCYAIYKRLFQDGYPWSYDLKEIAAYYLAYHRLMTHWKHVMPGVIHELSYEQLVTDFESRVRDLIDACDLSWESQCLDFEKNSATITTASAAQVRQPVNTSSVHRWRDYESQLAPLAEMLIDGGICID